MKRFWVPMSCMIAAACTTTLDTEQVAMRGLGCDAMIEWAEASLADGERFHLASLFWSYSVDSIPMYAAMAVECEDECEWSEADVALYSELYRPTHYWMLSGFTQRLATCFTDSADLEYDADGEIDRVAATEVRNGIRYQIQWNRESCGFESNRSGFGTQGCSSIRVSNQ